MVLLNLSGLTWVPKRQKRNQAIFMQLMRGGRFEQGLYVAPPHIGDATGRIAAGLPWLSKETFPDTGPSVEVLQPEFTLPFSYRRPVTRYSAWRIRRQIEARYLRNRPYVLWMNDFRPLHLALFEQLVHGATQRVFDSSDDFSEFTAADGRQGILNRLSIILRAVDNVVAVNQYVADSFDHPRKQVFLNCTDFETFQKVVEYRNPPLFPKPQTARYVGFAGGLYAKRADLPLLETLCRRMPETLFVFVGEQQGGTREFLAQFPNIRFIDTLPYDILPAVIRGFDVAIVPHLDNAFTRGNDLLKILDYFACGVPVVTTPCSGVERYAHACHIASGEAFVERVGDLLAQRIHHDPAPGYEIAREQSWSRQVPRLADGLFANLVS